MFIMDIFLSSINIDCTKLYFLLQEHELTQQTTPFPDMHQVMRTSSIHSYSLSTHLWHSQPDYMILKYFPYAIKIPSLHHFFLTKQVFILYKLSLSFLFLIITRCSCRHNNYNTVTLENFLFLVLTGTP